MSDNMGRCPACGLYVSVSPGQSTPPHQPPGERGTCPGAGQNAV